VSKILTRGVKGVAVFTNKLDGDVGVVPPINLLAGTIKPGARQRPISPAWDRKQQMDAERKHMGVGQSSPLTEDLI
jgi:hypothetical protein